MYKAVFLMTDWDYVMMLCLTQQILHKMCFCSCFMCKNKSF